jgi:hypothetical protein
MPEGSATPLSVSQIVSQALCLALLSLKKVSFTRMDCHATLRKPG